MNPRRLVGLVAVLVAGVVAPHAAAAPSPVELSTEISLGGLAWKTSRMPDLDQVRARTLTVLGLPGNGINYCAPTTAVDVLSYLARGGFRTGVDGTTDFAAPENYDAGTEAIRAMGVEMGTNATGGTGVLEFVDTFQQHLGRAAAVGTLHAVGGSYRSSDRLPPTAQELAEIGIDGAVVALILGRYASGTDNGGTFFRRIGGHFAVLSGVTTVRPYTAATLNITDPWTANVRDDTQSPYFAETYTMTMSTVRVRSTTNVVETHRVGILDGTYAGWHVEGYVALYPERYLTIRDGSLVRLTPKPFFEEGPKTDRYDLDSRVVDGAFSARTGRPYALLRNGAVMAVGIGPGGKGGRMADQRIARVNGATSLDVAPTGDVVVGGGTSLRIIGVNGVDGSIRTSSAIIDVAVEPTGGIVALTGKGLTLERFDERLKRSVVKRLARPAAGLDLDAKGVVIPAPIVRGTDAARRDDHGALVVTADGRLSVRGGQGEGIVKPQAGVGRLVAVHRAWELYDAKAYPGPIDTETRELLEPPPAPPLPPLPQ
jgi:hypothetical protein